MSKAYLAGPMRGIDQFNFPAFRAAAKNLRSQGWYIDSPAEHDEEMGFDPTNNSLEGWCFEDAMMWDLRSILDAAAVIVLPGWENSEGVQIELTVARAIGLPIYQYPLLTPLIQNDLSIDEPVTDEATRLVYGPRQASYGHPHTDFSRTGRIWGAILGIDDIPPHLVGLCLVGVKVSREVNAHKRDNLVDLAGYAATIDLVHEYKVND